MRCTNTAPDLSSLIERVSEIVSTATLSGTKRLVSSIPAMVSALRRQITAAHGSLQMGDRPRPPVVVLDSTIAAEALPLQRTRRERITGRNVAALEPVHEPALALFGCAVRERVRHRVALGLFLQAVVADGRSGLQRFVDVAGIEEIMFLLRTVRPDSRQTVGLQFDAHLDRVGLGLARCGPLR